MCIYVSILLDPSSSNSNSIPYPYHTISMPCNPMQRDTMR